MERDRAMSSQRFQFHDYTSIRDDFSLDDVTITKEILQDEQRRPLSPIESVSQRSQRSMASGTSMNKFADFFGNDVFQIVLHNPTTAHQMLKFAQARLCAENLEFLDKVSTRVTKLLATEVILKPSLGGPIHRALERVVEDTVGHTSQLHLAQCTESDQPCPDGG